MKPKGVLTGTHSLSGNQACAEGALAAGCRFLSAYPIPPSIEIIERFTQRAKEVDANLEFIEINKNIKTSLEGEYQKENASLAVDTVKKLSTRDGFKISDSQIKKNTLKNLL